MEHNEDNAIESRKALFNAFACCKYYKVDDAGEVFYRKKIEIEQVCVDRKGRVYVDWRFGMYDDVESAEVDVVRKAYGSYVEGVFTSEEAASAVAKAWFKDEKEAEIARLEEELARLKAGI